MTNLPSPQQLRYLTTLADALHFGRAAEACAVTQSTLSAGILALERQIDAALLDRTAGKRVVLTPLGVEVVGRARAALAALGAVTEAADAARAPMTGPFRLGLIPTIGAFLLPRLMPPLRETFPNLAVSLREGTTDRLREDLLAGRLDALVIAQPCECDGIETAALVKDELVVALPADHPLGNRADIPARALRAERLLLLEDGHCLRDQVAEACGATRADLASSRFAATSLHTLAQMVGGGLGVTLLPRMAIRGGVTAGAPLTLRPLAGAGVWRTICLGWRPGAPKTAEYRALAPLIAAAAGASAQAG